MALQAPYAVPNFASFSSNTWPSPSEWASLNSSVGGRLRTLRPWAAVCYTSDPLYNAEECQSVLSGYKNDTQREAVPAALLWTNWESCSSLIEGCALDYSDPQPIGNATCHQGSTPPYSISISDAQDASTIVRWATETKVKITVKNTGHDYQGRSAAPSTLQVNTHLLNNLSYVPEFVPQGSNATPVTALTMGAGAQMNDIYDYAVIENFMTVAGGCTTVGASGGYIQGGGHGLLTPAYGLAADNALEFEIVTADGHVLVANEAQNSDLFWAVRGGGAGSWGIVTSTTVRVYPPVSVGASLLTIIPDASQNLTTLGIEFLVLVAKYQNTWLDKGITSSIIGFQDEYLVSIYWPTTHADVSDLYAFFGELGARADAYAVTSNVTSGTMFSTVSEAVQENIGPFWDAMNPYGASNQLSSRLVPRSVLASEPAAVASAIWDGFEIVNGPLRSGGNGLFGPVPVMVLGDMPTATADAVNATGANPGLYAAAWHVVYGAPWTLGINATTNSAVMTAIHDAVGPLTALGVKGSYQNEGDAFEENWQEAFFGYKYATLSSIKQKYDPENFFTTYKGVDSMNLAAYQCYAAKQSELLQQPGEQLRDDGMEDATYDCN